MTALLFGTSDEAQRWLLLIKSCESSKDQRVNDGPGGWDLCRVPCPDWEFQLMLNNIECPNFEQM